MFLNISKGFELCGEWKQPQHEVYIHGHRVDVFTAKRSEIKYDRVRAKKIMRQREPSQVAERERERDKCECIMPLDFFTSGSGSASRINWPNSFTFPNVIFLSRQRRREG